jgi:hypothetical protein
MCRGRRRPARSNHRGPCGRIRSEFLRNGLKSTRNPRRKIKHPRPSQALRLHRDWLRRIRVGGPRCRKWRLRRIGRWQFGLLRTYWGNFRLRRHGSRLLRLRRFWNSRIVGSILTGHPHAPGATEYFAEIVHVSKVPVHLPLTSPALKDSPKAHDALSRIRRMSKNSSKIVYFLSFAQFHTSS